MVIASQFSTYVAPILEAEEPSQHKKDAKAINSTGISIYD